ncbi:hypothetical protein B4099_3321 [Heyndrickxia coagulans]|uniref:Uncharacterized protein n=1 Tax=Heyndrickxia coagulans TaxID=1398 RepID=A0A150KB87_HEYCO|nr:hypothetical protein B4099_3321 [Heyndrickxia coagulans]
MPVPLLSRPRAAAIPAEKPVLNYYMDKLERTQLRFGPT